MRSCTGADRAGLVLLLAALLGPEPLAEARTRNYAPFPKPDAGYVTDTVGLLTREQEQQLESQLLETERRSGVEIIVVTIRIMERKIVPRFRQGRYAEGIAGSVQALIREFGGTGSVPRWVLWAIAGTIAFLILVAISLFRNGKRSWGWVVVGLILVLVLALVWLIRRVTETASDRGGYASGGLGGYAGGAPGGLGGFGGGFSGGGGATGSW